MGQQNVDVVARWAEVLGHGSLGEELWDANLEIVNAKGWPVEATYRGHGGLRAGGTTSRRRSRISRWSSRR
jgi:hypothetical protein